MGSDRHGGSVDPQSELETRIRTRFAELGQQIHSPEFQEKARDAMVGALQAEISAKSIPPSLAHGLLQFLSVAAIQRK